MDNIEKIESDLWEGADQLRANSKLTSTDGIANSKGESNEIPDQE